MRRTRIVIATVMLALVWASAGVIYAITNGVPDGGRHPYVGVIAFYVHNQAGDLTPAWICSGSLISPTVVLTAGHCTDGAEDAQVWFNQDAGRSGFPSNGGIWAKDGGIHVHPDYTSTWRFGLLGWTSIDSGVVVLGEAVPMPRYAELPDPGLVDTLQMGTNVDLVGYGGQVKEQASGRPYDRWMTNFQRYFAPSRIVTSENRSSSMWLKLSANPGQGKGGICFGDSGGPDLLGGTDVILATNSFVANQNCAGVDYSNRVDRPVVLDWVKSFM